MPNTIIEDTVLYDRVREMLESVGTVKLHQFKDGRTIRVSRKMTSRGYEIYQLCLSNATTKFFWEDVTGYQNIDECIRHAEKIFGIPVWNVL